MSCHLRLLKHTTTLGTILVVGVLVSGCSMVGKKVSAFERGTLAKAGMQLVGAPKEQAGINHMYNAREGSVGGFGGAGGGCGCN
ncbi:MAG: DUF4266 domain-containing protein [Bdellovibrionaceae bacterium]|nr:DUF4266 domain-containing protein [Pseudobdellovibrionaceae bacterium]